MRLTKDQLYKPYGAGSGSTAVAAATTAANVSIADSGGLIDATTVEGALAELATEMAAIPSVTTHANADGAGGVNEPATNKVHNASAVELADAGSLYSATDVEAGIAEAMTVHNAHKNADGAGGTSTPAANMAHNAAALGIADAGSLFVAANVEAALQEEAAKRIQSKHFFSYAADEFPVQQCWYRNHSCDNTKSTSDSTPITIATIDTTNGTFGGVSYDGYITLSYVPYRTTLFSPTTGEEWAMIDLEYQNGGAEPSRTGDYTLRCKIIGGVYADKKLYYVVDYGAEGSLTVGDKVLLYNPHYSACGWDFLNSGSYLFTYAGSGWRSKYVYPGGVFKHSDGTYRMIINGVNSSTNVTSIGAASSSDLVTWTVLNSDAAYFTPSGSAGWRHTSIATGSGLYYLDYEQRYYLVCNGKDSSGRSTLGWIKFDENFANIEYATDEPITRTAAYDHWYPSVCKYGGRWILTYTLDDSPVDIGNWVWKQAYANRPEGPYGTPSDIFGASDWSSMQANDGLFCSSHFTDIMPFIWRGRMYALCFGCSRWNASGNRANALMGLLYWNEREGTPRWDIDPRSPIFFNAVYASANLWGSNYTWQNDHLGGRICLYQENQYTYFFFSGSSGTDSYRVMGRRLQLS